MKNIQNVNAGFVLTSISYSTLKRNDYYQNIQQPAMDAKRVIAKYDYCLPPEEKEITAHKK